MDTGIWRPTYHSNRNPSAPTGPRTHADPSLQCLCVLVFVDWQLVSAASAHTQQAGETFQLGLFRLRLLGPVVQQQWQWRRQQWRQRQRSLPQSQQKPRRWPGSWVTGRLAAPRPRGISVSLSVLSLPAGCVACEVNSWRGAVARRQQAAGVVGRGWVGGGTRNACESVWFGRGVGQEAEARGSWMQLQQGRLVADLCLLLPCTIRY